MENLEICFPTLVRLRNKQRFETDRASVSKRLNKYNLKIVYHLIFKFLLKFLIKTKHQGQRQQLNKAHNAH